jgi:hypothetical protein
MEHITIAGNVEVPAFLALQQLGFALERKVHSEDREFWIATRGDTSFSATSTLELLGLCLMRSTRGEEWKASDEEIDSYLRTYYPEALDDDDAPKA